MEFIEILKAIILGIVEGITEWLPISSTGHLILTEDFMPFKLSQEFVDAFFVVIQFGAILAVIIMFFNKLNFLDPGKSKEENRNIFILWTKIAVASIPLGVLGLLFEDPIEEKLYNPVSVALMLIIYGVAFILVESWNIKPKITDLSQISYMTAFGIGLFQTLALVPGTSRSGATIIGAVLLGTSRYIAAEFSFFLAIPAMVVASGYKLLKVGFSLTGLEWAALGTGSLVSFLVSLLIVKFLLSYIKKHDFKVFGYYRIVLGIIVLLYFYVLTR